MTDPTAPPAPHRRTRPGSASRRSGANEATPPLDRFFELTETLLCVIALNGRFRYVSPGWAATLGWPTDELLARPYLDFVHPEDRAATRAFALRAMTQGRDAPFENRCKTRDGGYRWLRWSARPVLADSLIYASAMDVTDHHTIVEELARNERVLARQAEELARARDAALAATRAKSGFLATMSHELRTPLNGMLGLTELLLDGELDEAQRQSATIIRRCGGALLALVNDVLDFSRLEAGRIELQTTPFSLPTVVHDALDIVAVEARRKGLALETAVDPGLPATVAGDAGRIRQVLFNLLSNAVKFTDAGRVTIGVRRVPHAPAPLTVRFQVSDTGVGIAPEMQPLLFERFSQVDSSASRRYGGAGLGLAICKGLVELMEGRIGVSSGPGSGATFWFTVPLEVAEAVAHDAAPEGDPPVVRPGRRVLVVEDNDVNQLVTRRMLEKLGVEVEVAGNGRVALDRLSAGNFDLVLMDCQMPEMDGYTATRAIRAREEDSRVPIVALTASALAGDRERCLAAGMDDYLSKPVTTAELTRVIGRWLPA